jgi:hypothetical protein
MAMGIRLRRGLLIASVAAIGGLLSVSAAALAQDAEPRDGAISCSSPVAPKDSAKSLTHRYGKDAVIAELPGAEGEKYKGVALFPRARDQRIEISFAGNAMNAVAGLSIRNAGKGSRWNIAGVSIGSRIEDVQKANGRPFVVSGFGWDYGGFVTDWKGGALASLQPGGCRIMLRFDKEAGAPTSLLGDGVKISSDSAALRKWGPVVSEMGVNFPSGR